ncbi:hypothetical protein HDE_11917 [Halotydeus destructor]|nr:hypothetical protein HDE_11917 [Halotydeus destructor]
MQPTGLFLLATIVYSVNAVSRSGPTTVAASGKGLFAFVDGKKSQSWVKSHRIIAVHEKHASKYKLKTFKITQGSRSIKAKVYDKCSDKDCKNCCTKNSKKTGFLIDMEKYTLREFGGSGSGVVKWECLDC